MNERLFDASKYITQLDGREYLEVKWRLLWLRTEHPDAIINTELVDHDKETAVFKAHVKLPDGGESTGWGTVNANDFDEYIEAAETKALGRALAALGYGTQFCKDYEIADREAEGGIIVDSPVARPDNNPGSYNSNRGSQEGRGATEAQLKAILAIGRAQYNLNDAEMDKWSLNLFGREVKDLSRKEASEFIDKLKNQRKVA